MVVGEQQPLRGDEFSCAAATELHDGILQAGLVETENLLCSEFAAEPLHFRKILSVDEIRLPHAFFGAGGHRKHHDGDAKKLVLFFMLIWFYL